MKKHFLGIRNKLISIFIVIKVVPLIVLAWFSWNEISTLVIKIQHQYEVAVEESKMITQQVVNLSTDNSIRALDLKSRESIERLSTDTARQVASFLYDRDQDVALAALIEPDVETYKQFLSTRNRLITVHDQLVMDGEGEKWEFTGTKESASLSSPTVDSPTKDNEKDFHARQPNSFHNTVNRPLYLEMTFLDLNGVEQIKVTTSDSVTGQLRDVSRKDNTYCRAETYFQYLSQLHSNEVYVSEVIGPYVKTDMIGPYTKSRAKKMGIKFAPDLSGYAGLENPVGKRFQGLIRWATPFVKEGKRIGYVTLALDHSHIMEFTDYIAPTEERYLSVSDASTGNYAFMWDYRGRNISHPRDYFIVGYDPSTGKQEIPWLEKSDYLAWKKSGMPPADFLQTLPLFHQQSLEKKPATEQIVSGFVGLDCRYLNFAPQCTGWTNLTQNGGSGSFLIYWSNLWKLTTAATIPYYTGIYKDSPRGFGYVTIGANVDEFHRDAVQTASLIKEIEQTHLTNLDDQGRRNKEILFQTVRKTVRDLSSYTVVMVFIVIFIAIWMASMLTGRILQIIKSLNRFQRGEMDHRLEIHTGDEVEDLAVSFNSMADNIKKSITEIQSAKELTEKANIRLQGEVIERQNAEVALSEHRDNLEKLVAARTQELEQEIEERKQAQESQNELKLQLHRAEKMEAIGTLAGGVAHDLNNILSGIVTYPEILLMDMADDNPLYQPLTTIKTSGEKAAAIVQDLLTLARRGVPINEVLDFNTIVYDYLSSPEYLKLLGTHPRVAVDVNLTDNLLPVLGSYVHLFKTIMNLVCNGIESMPEGGDLSIRTENVYMDTPLKLHDNVVEGEYITFSVIDTGVGIHEADLERIFEPFFTKKKMGQSGTGLGMAVVWGTIHDHNGYIDCQSELGKGTVFTLYLPVCRDGVISENAASDFPTLVGHNETILVVDDVAQQLDIASIILANLNYTVFTAASGEEALVFLEKYDADLVVLDMIMDPGINGLETYKRIIEKNPDQKVIIASGYSETDSIRQVIGLGVTSYLKKPYSVASLGESVKAGLMYTTE